MSKVIKEFSRSKIKKLILDGKVFVNGRNFIKPKKKISGVENIFLSIEYEKNFCLPEKIPINIIYEDDQFFLVNKQKNLVVHPGAGNLNGTLMNSVLYHFPKNSGIVRAGIVHRLDKDTTGLMIIAKSNFFREYLIKLFKKREIIREYKAIVDGCIYSNGVINQPISRHKFNRKRMTISNSGKFGLTYYEVIENFRYHTMIRVFLKSGRTHQARVHLAYIKHSIFGDPIYGKKIKFYKKFFSKKVFNILSLFKRQALHSSRISFKHPVTKKILEWVIPFPDDMKLLVNTLRKDKLKYK